MSMLLHAGGQCTSSDISIKWNPLSDTPAQSTVVRFTWYLHGSMKGNGRVTSGLCIPKLSITTCMPVRRSTFLSAGNGIWLRRLKASVAHNHPSSSDRAVTKKLQTALGSYHPGWSRLFVFRRFETHVIDPPQLPHSLFQSV